MKLLEAYANRVAFADDIYAQKHNGERMSDHKKLVVAKCIHSVNKFLNEAFENTVGTQRAAMGDYKKFAINLTNVAVPNLIAHDLVIVQPMSSFSGYINYIKYTKGSNKGASKAGDTMFDPFRIHKPDVSYTDSAVVEAFTVGWTPVTRVVKVLVDGEALEESKITFDAASGKITLQEAPALDKEVRIAYAYDNVVIPQNDIPTLNAEMASMSVTPKVRRIAIFYSQIAAYQAKTDFGVSLGEQLAEKSVGELEYEIDTEIVNLLIDNAEKDESLRWNKAIPLGVSKADHYAGFLETFEAASQVLYDRTQRFTPNYALISSTVKNVLIFVPGFNAAPTNNVNGPYLAGTLNGKKIFVTPSLAPGKFVLGVNGGDMLSSAAVYMPYMPIVPTAALQGPDGGSTQGWSTVYGLEMLNKDLLVAGEIYEDKSEYAVAVTGGSSASTVSLPETFKVKIDDAVKTTTTVSGDVNATVSGSVTSTT